MEKATLYDLTQQYQELMAMADDPEVDEQIFRDTLEGLEGEIEEKANAYGCVIRNLEVNVGEIDGRIQAIQKILDAEKAHKASIENRIDDMKNNLCTAMIACDKQKIKTDKFTIWTQKTTPAVEIPEEATVAMDYLIPQPPKVDKKKIAEDLKKGVKLDFARLVTRDIVRFR